MAFVGCIGVSIGSKWLLYLVCVDVSRFFHMIFQYLGFLFLLLIVQSATGIMGFLHDSLARERVKHSLYSTISRTYAMENGPENSFKITWDYMQRTVCYS
jgi:hypothetical protein